MNDSQDVSITQPIIKLWLEEKHCTLWQQWDIKSPDGLDNASKWMIDQIASIAAFAASAGSLANG